MEYIFFGNHSSLPGRLERALEQHVVECPTLTQFCQAMIHLNPVNFCVFLENNDIKDDLDVILKLRKLYSNAYIILFASSLDKEEKIAYIRTTCEKNDKKVDRLYSFRLPFWKRTFDIAASLGAILCLSPVLAITVIAIELESKGPIVYKSKRVGTNYKIFDFYKFRSMYPDADKRLAEYKTQNQYNIEAKGAAPFVSAVQQRPLANDHQSAGSLLYSDDFSMREHDYLKSKSIERANAFFKIENDPRVTRVGRILRKYSIDELPQLFNILKGDMSVVGNRPLPIYEAEQLTSDNYIERFMALSGLTGLWQVEKRGNGGGLSPEERKQLDIKYARTFSFSMDMKIIFRTFMTFIQKENV